MTTASERREVLRYFGLIVAVALGAASLLLFLIYQRYTSEGRMRQHLVEYHLPTSMLAREVSSRVAILRVGSSGTDAIGPGESGRAARRSVSERNKWTSLHAIARSIESIDALQREHGEETFRGTVERARSRFDRIRVSQESGATGAAVGEELEVFALNMSQLDRLHSGAAKQALAEISSGGARSARRLTFVVAAVLVVSAALMWRLLSLIRARLRQHKLTREALQEKDRELMQAQKMEALGTLVGGVAHDFNNLLTVILGNVEALLSGLAEDDLRHDELREVQEAGERAAELTRQLLIFSRYDVVETQVVDLTLLVRDLEPMLQRLIPADISLILADGQDLCRVDANYVQMEQVLINLATNAVDAMPHGGTLTIYCSAVQVERGAADSDLPAGRYARVRVRDTGHGMRSGIRERIFDPFFTTKEQGKGTGLGLSTVHGIVTKSRGYIFVESESGSGTTFDVYLPRCEDAHAEAEEAGPVVDTWTGTETILLVEDQDQVRELAAAGLRSAGYRVIEAANGADALHTCETQEAGIDLILSDVVMPKMRGPEFVERAREVLPSAAVVFTSGYSEEGVLKKVRESGRPLVSKPFKLQHLLQVVRQELDAQAQSGQRPKAGSLLS